MTDALQFYRRLAGGSEGLLGTAVHRPDGWRFIPNIVAYRSSRKAHKTWEACLPRWVGYPHKCESRKAVRS